MLFIFGFPEKYRTPMCEGKTRVREGERVNGKYFTFATAAKIRPLPHCIFKTKEMFTPAMIENDLC